MRLARASERALHHVCAILAAILVAVEIVVLFAGVMVAIVLLVTYLWLGPYGHPVGGGRIYYFPFFGGFFLILLLLWVGFFALRMALWRGMRGRYGPGPGGPRRAPAVMIARQRYARGEITREQYEQIVSDLRRRRTGP